VFGRTFQRNVENQKRLRRHSGVCQRGGGTDGTPVASVGRGQERRAEEDVVLRREATADRLRTDAARLRVVQKETVERSKSREQITLS